MGMQGHFALSARSRSSYGMGVYGLFGCLFIGGVVLFGWFVLGPRSGRSGARFGPSGARVRA